MFALLKSRWNIKANILSVLKSGKTLTKKTVNKQTTRAEYSGLKVGSAAARAGHRSTLPLAAERIPLQLSYAVEITSSVIIGLNISRNLMQRPHKLECTFVYKENVMTFQLVIIPKVFKVQTMTNLVPDLTTKSSFWIRLYWF